MSTSESSSLEIQQLEAEVALLKAEVQRLREELRRVQSDRHERPPHWG